MKASLKCSSCNLEINNVEVWLLKDIENFTARKLVFANCTKCFQPIVSLIEKRISDGQLFINENIQGLNAVKTIYREKSRLVTKVYNIKSDELGAWVYGHNVAYKNRKGEITKIKQYSKSYKGNGKRLVKEFIPTN